MVSDSQSISVALWSKKFAFDTRALFYRPFYSCLLSDLAFVARLELTLF